MNEGNLLDSGCVSNENLTTGCALCTKNGFEFDKPIVQYDQNNAKINELKNKHIPIITISVKHVSVYDLFI